MIPPAADLEGGQERLLIQCPATGWICVLCDNNNTQTPEPRFYFAAGAKELWNPENYHEQWDCRNYHKHVEMIRACEVSQGAATETMKPGKYGELRDRSINQFK